MTLPKETSNGAALELVNDAYLVGDDVSDAWQDWPLEYKCDVLSWLDSVGAAVRKVKRQLAEDLEKSLGKSNAYRCGDTFYCVGQAGSWNTKKDPANDGTLAEFLGPDWIHAVNLAASGAVTMTRLKQLAKQRLLESNSEAKKEDIEAIEKQVINRFFEYKYYGDPVRTVPFNKAQAWLQKLEDGQTLYPPGKKELGE